MFVVVRYMDDGAVDERAREHSVLRDE